MRPSASNRFLLPVVAALLALGLVACGDDGDDDASGEDDVAAYCEFSASLDEGDELPGDEQFETLRDLAPSEISDEVDQVVDDILEQGEAVFAEEGNEDFFEALEAIEAFEEENCGRDDVDTEESPEDE